MICAPRQFRVHSQVIIAHSRRKKKQISSVNVTRDEHVLRELNHFDVFNANLVCVMNRYIPILFISRIIVSTRVHLFQLHLLFCINTHTSSYIFALFICSSLALPFPRSPSRLSTTDSFTSRRTICLCVGAPVSRSHRRSIATFHAR